MHWACIHIRQSRKVGQKSRRSSDLTVVPERILLWKAGLFEIQDCSKQTINRSQTFRLRTIRRVLWYAWLLEGVTLWPTVLFDSCPGKQDVQARVFRVQIKLKCLGWNNSCSTNSGHFRCANVVLLSSCGCMLGCFIMEPYGHMVWPGYRICVWLATTAGKVLR